MNLIKFIDYRYQELALESAKKAPSAFRGAQSTALGWLLNLFVIVGAIVVIPLIFLQYFAVCLRLRKRPIPEVDLMKAQHDQQKMARDNKLRQKVGMSSKMKIPEDF